MHEIPKYFRRGWCARCAVQSELRELVAGSSCAWLRSKTVKKSIDPEFDQVFLLEVPLNEEQFLPGAANLQLHLRVYDWDRGSADDYLGACGYI